MPRPGGIRRIGPRHETRPGSISSLGGHRHYVYFIIAHMAEKYNMIRQVFPVPPHGFSAPIRNGGRSLPHRPPANRKKREPKVFSLDSLLLLREGFSACLGCMSFLRKNLVKLLHKRIDILKLAVHRREAHIGHLVQGF